MACCCCIFGIIQLYFGVIYPLKMTYNSYLQQEKVTLWINYWIIMSLFYILESVTFDVLFMIPFYEAIKTLYAIWLYHEKFQGALLIGGMASPIYKMLTPLLAGFQDKINLIEQEKQQVQEKEKTQ